MGEDDGDRRRVTSARPCEGSTQRGGVAGSHNGSERGSARGAGGQNSRRIGQFVSSVWPRAELAGIAGSKPWGTPATITSNESARISPTSVWAKLDQYLANFGPKLADVGRSADVGQQRPKQCRCRSHFFGAHVDPNLPNSGANQLISVELGQHMVRLGPTRRESYQFRKNLGRISAPGAIARHLLCDFWTTSELARNASGNFSGPVASNSSATFG